MIDFPIPQIAQELRLAQGQVAATVSLLDDGATVPFIARYRKENTASLDEVAIPISVTDCPKFGNCATGGRPSWIRWKTEAC